MEYLRVFPSSFWLGLLPADCAPFMCHGLPQLVVRLAEGMFKSVTPITILAQRTGFELIHDLLGSM